MIRQNNADDGTTPQRITQQTNIMLHLGIVRAHERNIQPQVSVQPEILILQVYKALNIAQSVGVELGNAANNQWFEGIGMLRNGTSNLHLRSTWQWWGRKSFRDQQ